MNGQEIFVRLSTMTEEQRKSCQFWWMTDKALIHNFLDGLRNDYNEINEEVWAKIEKDLNGEVISQIQDDVEETMNEMDAFAGIWDDYTGELHIKLNDFIREKAKENGIEIKWDF
jgi:hypothetical protein